MAEGEAPQGAAQTGAKTGAEAGGGTGATRRVGGGKGAVAGVIAALVVVLGMVLVFGLRLSPAPVSPTETAATAPAGAEPAALMAPEAGAAAPTETAETREATPDPVQEPATETAAAPEVASVETAEPMPEPGETVAIDTTDDVASFDQVRASADGTITLAGRVEPGATVEVLLDGAVIDTVTALAGGSFASVALAGPSAAGRLLSVRVTGADGQPRESRTNVIVDPGAETVAVSEGEGARVLAAADPAQLTIDTFSAAEAAAGGTISGRGAPAGSVIRAYLDGAEAGLAAPGPDGAWSITLPQVAAGVHQLRVDALDAAGKVLARAETEVTRLAAEPTAEPPAAVAAETAPAPVAAAPSAAEEAAEATATPVPEVVPAPETATVPPRLQRIEVRPGDTLWAIAGAAYGDPLLYVQVFKANAGQIRDPDRIYPGQVFELPE